MNKLLQLLVMALDQWPLTPEECRDASNAIFYFHYQPDGRVVALTLYPHDPEMCTSEMWEEESMLLLAPIIAMYLEGLRSV